MQTLVLVIVCLSLVSGCCSEGIDIKVKKVPSVNLTKYRTAKIDVQYGEYRSNAKGDAYLISERSYIGGQLFGLLENCGISPSYADTDVVDLRVECFFRRGIGCPHLNRHYNLELIHTSFVGLRFIDIRRNEIIGEVECRRPFFKRLHYTYVRLMFDELWKEKKDNRDSGKAEGSKKTEGAGLNRLTENE